VLPLTDADVQRVSEHTGQAPTEFVRFITKDDIAMDDEPEAFATLRQGKRVMTMRQGRGRCHFLGDDDRCTIYDARPLGCRVFPLDASFGKRNGKLRRLTLIEATDCKYELDGKQRVSELRRLSEAYAAANDAHRARIAEWNAEMKRRKRAGRAAGTAREYLAFLGL
jgi:Fe-S-cluster containining protein